MTVDRSSVRNSATGMAIHAPVKSRKVGKINKLNTINTSVRQKEIIAEIRPLDKAVKNPEEVMFKPLNRKLMAKILNPGAASRKVSASCVKTETIGVDNVTAAIVRRTEEIPTKRKAIRWIFFSSFPVRRRVACAVLETDDWSDADGKSKIKGIEQELSVQ